MDNFQAKFDSIIKSDLNKILSEGLAELYRQNPTFPITYLASWLKQYSSSEKLKAKLIQQKKNKQIKYYQIQENKIKQNQVKQQEKRKKQHQIVNINNNYTQTIQKTQYLEDLLVQWLPEFIQKTHNFTGTYIGKLDYPKKALQEHNFELGAENNLQNPKIISYIGSCKSHSQLMINKYLPNSQGRSYQIFQQSPQPQQNNQQGKQEQKNITIKKKYLYVQNVLKQKKMYYFKYPKLGAYACFPLKYKSLLNIPTFQKGILDYKAYLKNKQQIEKEYNQRLNEARIQAEQINKKLDQFEGNQQDPLVQENKKALIADVQAADLKFKELQNNPPIVQQTVFNINIKSFFLGCDTLGLDKEISTKVLDQIQQKMDYFVTQWEKKQKKMILDDILVYLQEEPLFQALQIQLQQFEKNVISNYEPQIKEQYTNKRQKEGQFQFSLIKAQKLRQLLKDNGFKNSMQVYLNYKIPKYTQIIQIMCMLLGMDKKQINFPQSNTLNHRKIINQQSFNSLFDKLTKYQLRRNSSQAVPAQYKINKLLQRLQKIQIQGLARYNSFLLLLLTILKTYCWTRILCRDARKQVYQTKLKLKQQRDGQINKWNQDIQKKLQSSKAELDQEGLQTFNQQDWRKGYEAQNPKPQALEEPVYLEHLDIE